MNLPIEIQNVRRRGISHRPLSSAYIRSYLLLSVLTCSQFALVGSYMLLCTLIGSYTLIMKFNNLKAF